MTNIVRDSDVVEITAPPYFSFGEKVKAKRTIRNDGTYAGKEIGEILVKKGEEGYVVSIGTFLQQFYIYGVEFLESGNRVGMKRKELDPVVAQDEMADLPLPEERVMIEPRLPQIPMGSAGQGADRPAQRRIVSRTSRPRRCWSASATPVKSCRSERTPRRTCRSTWSNSASGWWSAVSRKRSSHSKSGSRCDAHRLALSRRRSGRSLIRTNSIASGSSAR